MNHQIQPRFSLQQSTQSPISLSRTVQDHNRVIFSNRKLENINCVYPSTDDYGGLFVGDIISTLKEHLLANFQIKAILTCMVENSNSFLKIAVKISPMIQHHKVIPIRDILEYPIINHFDDAIEFIQDMRKQKINVLVHCHAGVSRSASVVCAYLIKINNWTPVQALEFLKQRRERVKPNVSFWNQLHEYHFKCSQKISPKKLEPIQNSTDVLANQNFGQIGLNEQDANKNNIQKKLQIKEKDKVEQKRNQKEIKEAKEEQQKKQKFAISRNKKTLNVNHLEDKIGQALEKIMPDYTTPIKSEGQSTTTTITGKRESQNFIAQKIFTQNHSSYIFQTPTKSQNQPERLMNHLQPKLIFSHHIKTLNSQNRAMRQIKYEHLHSSMMSPFQVRTYIRSP